MKTIKSGDRLRLGYTTGSCAAAASKAAAAMLVSDEEIYAVKIVTPDNTELRLEIVDISRNGDSVSCAVVKDAGGDPDVTNGIKIYSIVRKSGGGIKIDGGEGIGRVTKKGLSIEIGEAAINPVPRDMIRKELLEVSKRYSYNGGFDVCISAPCGEEIAKRTFNPRLGIKGGISILGTTGIVEPMSDRAIIDTIKLEMNMHKAADRKALLITPGNYGMNFFDKYLHIDTNNVIVCSNFLGETIDYALYSGFDRVLIVGHAGKLIKLAGGIMNTHSKTADCRMEILAAHAALNGAPSDIIKEIMEAVTVKQAFLIIEQTGIKEKVLKSLKEKIKFFLNHRSGNELNIEFIVFLNQNSILLESDGAEELLDFLHN